MSKKISLGADLLSAPPQTIKDRGGASQVPESELPVVLLAGVDTAYISCFVSWGESSLDLFERIKQGKMNAKTDAGGWVDTLTRLGGMVVAPTGSKKSDGPYFEYRITLAGFEIELRDPSRSNPQIPDVVVKCGAVKCLECGNDFKAIADAVDDLFAALGAVVSIALPSRVDLFWDIAIPFAGIDHAFRLRDWVCRGRRLDSYGSELVRKVTHHAEGLRPEGFTIGSDLKLRCYDKRFELVGQTDKAILLEARWKHSGPVSRVEFQLRREPLKARGIVTCEDLIEKMESLQAYLVTRWVTFRDGVGKDRRNMKRKPLYPWWAAIKAHSPTVVEPIAIVENEHVRRRRKQWVDQIRGCLLSWAGEQGLEGEGGWLEICEQLTSDLFADGLSDSVDRLKDRAHYRESKYGSSCLELERVYRAEQANEFAVEKGRAVDARRYVESGGWVNEKHRAGAYSKCLAAFLGPCLPSDTPTLERQSTLWEC